MPVGPIQSTPITIAPRGEYARTAGGLTPAEQRQVDELRAIDRRVRTHEMAHLSAGSGVVTGGPSFGYRRGPDGLNYAVSGEVPIDASPGRTPEETIARAQAIRSAALAPADPSPQDRAVAARASQMEATARAELARAGRSIYGGDAADRSGSTDPSDLSGSAANPALPQIGLYVINQQGDTRAAALRAIA
jgi:hypothetical protein